MILAAAMRYDAMILRKGGAEPACLVSDLVRHGPTMVSVKHGLRFISKTLSNTVFALGNERIR